MTVETYDNYYVIKNVLTDTQINTLISYFNNKNFKLATDGINPEIHYEDWYDTSIDNKQKIIADNRNAEVLAIPLGTYSWLDTIYSNIFTAVHGSSLTLRGPNYFNKHSADGFYQTYEHIPDLMDRDGNVPPQYTCSINLSDTSDYTGGDLEINKYIADGPPFPVWAVAPRDKGSAIIYRSIVWNKIHPVISGTRYSINELAS